MEVAKWEAQFDGRLGEHGKASLPALALPVCFVDFLENLALTITKFPIRIMLLEFAYIADPPDVVAYTIVLFVFPV